MVKDVRQGGLFIVATPIGNLGDISFRAIDTLKNCEVIACEDTRVSRKLLTAYSINKPLISYHDYNADKVRPTIIKKINSGQSIALISDAGTPLISDPGYKLVRKCYELNIPVTLIPGPSAVIAGLVLSGMPTDRFVFAGFVDKKKFPELSPLPMTLIFFESAKRLKSTLKDMIKSFQDREIAVVREISKRFEDVRRGTFDEILSFYDDMPAPKGEIVLVLGPPTIQQNSQEDIDQLLQKTLEAHSMRDACQIVAEVLGISRKDVYARGLELTKQKRR
jgi:16S rRNA (cytidine1402-2'-O)-methyltransferase